MITNKDLLTPIIEKKQCCQCIHVINYGWHAVKAECEITHKSWGNYAVVGKVFEYSKRGEL